MTPSELLAELGLSQYEPLFQSNDIDESVLPSLTEEDLKGIGISSLGHRKKILTALAGGEVSAAPSPAVARPAPQAASVPATQVSQPVSSENGESEIVEVDLQNGLWFNNAGLVFPIKEDLYPEEEREFAYVLALGDHMSKFIANHPKLISWIQANPPAQSPDQAAWMDQVMLKLFAEGWNVLWRGEVTTSATSKGEVLSSLWLARDGIKTLGWPEDLTLVVQRVWVENGETQVDAQFSTVPFKDIL